MVTIIVHDQKWFIDRIGKRIYRKNNICNCAVCLNVHEVGLIIVDEMHAIYLYDCQELELIYYDLPDETKPNPLW
jgi:hypothetical protein